MTEASMKLTKLISKVLWISMFILVANLFCLKVLDCLNKLKLSDALLIEGALLMVIGGLTDVFRSPTVANVRRLLGGEDIHAAPIRPMRSPVSLLLLLCGILLCLEALCVLNWPGSFPFD